MRPTFRLAVRSAYALSLLCALLAVVPSARAESSIHGLVSGRALLDVGGRYGGGVSVDGFWGEGLFRVGATFGVAALSSGDGASSRVLTPAGLSLALLPRYDRSGPMAVARGGAYAGAQKGGLIVGPWSSLAVGYRWALGEGASVSLGADANLFLFHGGGLFWGPYLALGF